MIVCRQCDADVPLIDSRTTATNQIVNRGLCPIHGEIEVVE